MTVVDATTAHAPITHHALGQTNNATAAATKRMADTSHRAPKIGEIGCVSCGSSARPNAITKPRM